MYSSGQYNYHVKTYGHPSKFGYKDVCTSGGRKLNPEELIRLYAKTGPGTSSRWPTTMETSIVGIRSISLGTA